MGLKELLEIIGEGCEFNITQLPTILGENISEAAEISINRNIGLVQPTDKLPYVQL